MSEVLKQYTSFLESFIEIHKKAGEVELGTFTDNTDPDRSGIKTLVFSPHPDDECMVGALPLRLRKEYKADVVNVAVTLGSNKARQAGRLAELSKALKTLDFNNIVAGNPETGLEKVAPATRESDPSAWAEKVGAIKDIIKAEQPKIAVFPHDDDFNSSHIGTYYVVMDAITAIQKEDPSFKIMIAETEVWHMMSKPNFLCGLSTEDEATIIYALSAHTEEVIRNPYHIKHPDRAHDNVLRASEVIGGQGGAGADMDFGSIYRISVVENGVATPAWEGGRMVAPSEVLDELVNIAKAL